MDRTVFYKITDVGNGNEYDHLYNNLSKFTMTYPATYYRVKEEDIMRLDLVSYKVYKTVDYWWLIGVVNQIQDPFNDVTVGDLLKIPNILDIYNFYKKYSLR
jgi:hypothetical protein